MMQYLPLLAETNTPDAAPAGILGAVPWTLVAAGITLAVITVALVLRKQPPARQSIGPASTGSGQLPLLLHDADELAQRLAADLDARAERLERLIREADDRLARLGATATASTAPTPLPSHASADPVTREVYTLADQGKTPIEIARSLGQHTGQVELILALRRRQPA